MGPRERESRQVTRGRQERPPSRPSSHLVSDRPPPWPKGGRRRTVSRVAVAFPHRSQFREVHVGGLGGMGEWRGLPPWPSSPSGCIGDGSCAVSGRHLAPVTSQSTFIYKKETRKCSHEMPSAFPSAPTMHREAVPQGPPPPLKKDTPCSPFPWRKPLTLCSCGARDRSH